MPNDPIVGWIKAAGHDFTNTRDALAFVDFRGIELDGDRLSYFEQYLIKYYHDVLKPGQGMEEALECLQRFGAGGTWLDVGAGTTTLFWSLALDDIHSVWCADIVVEALAILSRFAGETTVPRCYADALAHLGRPPSHLAAMRKRLDRFLVFDVLAPWPANLATQRFDLITAFGIYGIATDAHRYAACFEHAATHLREGGRAIGADWVRRAAFIREDGHDNGYLERSLTAASAEAAGLRQLTCRQMPIVDDPQYEALIIWAFEKE